MSYSYARYKKIHDLFVAAINHGEFPLTYSGKYLTFDFIDWPHYSKTLKIFLKAAPTLEFYADAFLISTGLDLVQYRDRLVETTEQVRHEENTLQSFFEDVMDALPHGSGIDADWTLGEVTDTDVTFRNSYHTMDEWGGYDGWIDFTVTYQYDHAARTVKNPEVLSSETEWIREYENDEEELVEVDNLPEHLEYLAQCFDEEMKL